MSTSLARRAWTLFEPIHAIVYFAPEAPEHYTAAGLRGGWMGYFASRSAPMGASPRLWSPPCSTAFSRTWSRGRSPTRGIFQARSSR